MEAVVASEALSPAKQRCFWHIVLGATAELVAGRAPHEHVA
jgi:hypothetical protein